MPRKPVTPRDYDNPLPDNCTEARFQEMVIRIAKLRGWRVAHFPKVKDRHGRWRTPVAADGAGFPDLTLAKDGQVLFFELKTNKGYQEGEQKLWQKAMGDNYHLLRPRDYALMCQLLGYVPPKPRTVEAPKDAFGA